MDRLRQFELLDSARGQLGPCGHSELGREVVHECLEVGALDVVEGGQVLGHVVRHLLDSDVELLLTELLDLLLDLAVFLNDLLAGDLSVDGLHIAVEGDGGFGSDVPEAERVEHGVVRRFDYACKTQGIAETFPRPSAGADCARISALGRVEPLLVS